MDIKIVNAALETAVREGILHLSMVDSRVDGDTKTDTITLFIRTMATKLITIDLNKPFEKLENKELVMYQHITDALAQTMLQDYKWDPMQVFEFTQLFSQRLAVSLKQKVEQDKIEKLKTIFGQ